AALAGALQAHGVRVDALAGVERAPRDARTVWEHEGASLGELLQKMLPPSDNFIAEMLCRQIAKRRDPAAGFQACNAAQRDYAQSIGIDPRTLSLHDGSGLSRYDLIPPRDLALLLAAIARQPNGALIRAALPRPGSAGTLADRFAGSPLASRISAKTGSMKHVENIAGYVESEGSGKLAFAVLIQGFAAEADRPAAAKAAERIVEAIANL
ncbi:MAG: D-alanyl-D-alanine carboxypeptidase/D-alanyl-D-alanine-endopeptidase, partial [bacterium]|nr:D-alanyl-D-alanine carboxypeptidase/D-alanyl-D-alanine-endopeptidase [bacterium]